MKISIFICDIIPTKFRYKSAICFDLEPIKLWSIGIESWDKTWDLIVISFSLFSKNENNVMKEQHSYFLYDSVRYDVSYL